jgi:hemolysin D
MKPTVKKPVARPVAKPARKPPKKVAAKNAAYITRHPLKAATLLYSSPNPLFRSPVYYGCVTSLVSH